jgi:CRP/FNR family transcriptional regulator, cyclic AMP receptor protein
MKHTMNTDTASSESDIQQPGPLAGLLNALTEHPTEDALARFTTRRDWEVLAPYLRVEEFSRGHILTARGALDRTLYFLESGLLRVHYGSDTSGFVVATVGPGSVLGEGAFFSELERNATVQAAMPCRVWSLTPDRFKQLRKIHPEVALSLAMALGATVSMRMLDVTKRAVVT